jgi:hypothetical protein
MAGDTQDYFAYDYTPHAVTIATAEATSAAVDLGNWTYMGIYMPSSWSVHDGVTTNATMTFQVATALAGTYVNLYDVNNIEVSIANATASIGYTVSATNIIPWRYMKFRAGSSAYPATQEAARTIWVMTK